MNQWHALCVCREENSVLRYSMAPPLQHSTTQRTVDVSDRKEKIPTQFPHCLLSFIKFLEKSDVSGMSFMLIGNGKLAGHRKAIEVFYCGVPPQCSAVSERWSVWIYDHQLHVSLSEPREKWSHEGGGALRLRGTPHEVGTPTSIVGASRLWAATQTVPAFHQKPSFLLLI